MDNRAFDYLINQKISYFPSGDNPVPDGEITIATILNNIKSGRWKDEIEWYRQETDKKERESVKLRFPAVTFSGVFSYRKASNILKYTHVVVIDLDKKHFEESFEKIWTKIVECPFVFAAFESPSGGIKALAFSRMKLENHRNLLFPCLEDYFLRNYGLRIDTSGKDVSRLCFISFDPNLFLSGNNKRPFDAKVDSEDIYKSIKNSFVEVSSVDYDKYQNSTNVRHVFETARKWAVGSTGGFKVGSRNNYIYYLSCILNRAGMYESTTFDILSSRYPSMNKSELKSTVHSAYFHHRNEFAIKPILELKKTNQKRLL